MTATIESKTVAGPYTAWRVWTERRDAAVRAPYGFLGLVATVWLTGTEQKVDGLPGCWSAAPGGRTRLRAVAADGFLLDGAPVTGPVELRPDADPEPQALTAGSLRVVPIVREGRAAVRVYDPESAAHRAFRSIEYFPYAEDAVALGVYEPFDRERVEPVPNADGATRGLALAGAVRFRFGGQEHRLAVSTTATGFSAGFGDATNGEDTFGFRFLALPAPDRDGRVLIDFNRAYLPPCAFSRHSLCALPPAGNRLSAAVAAGEKRARFRR